MNELPVRKQIRLRNYDYSQSGCYFVTMCVKDKQELYVIMPNHIHMIIVIRQTAGDRGRSPLQEIVRNLKSYVTKTAGFSPWQRSFHDHIIRNDEDYLRIWKYIDENPARWSEDIYYVKPRATEDGRPMQAT